MPKCDFKVAREIYWSQTSIWVFSSKLAAYFQSTFSHEHLWRTASVIWRALLNLLRYSSGVICYIVVTVKREFSYRWEHLPSQAKRRLLNWKMRKLTWHILIIIIIIRNLTKKTFNWLSNNNVKANFSKYHFFL